MQALQFGLVYRVTVPTYGVDPAYAEVAAYDQAWEFALDKQHRKVSVEVDPDAPLIYTNEKGVRALDVNYRLDCRILKLVEKRWPLHRIMADPKIKALCRQLGVMEARAENIDYEA